MPLPRRRLLLTLAAVVVVAASLFLFSFRRFFIPQHVPGVVSIKTSATYQDPALLSAAFALPVASAYQQAGIAYQPNGSVCGPTSLANVLRTFGEPSALPASVLEGSGKCPFGTCWGGLSLDELAGLARSRTGKKITVLRGLDLPAFREHLVRSNDPSRRYVVNFDRGPLFGTAGGHHSPIGGYLAEQDLVLVLDVNEKYKPWLVDTARLHAAMDTPTPSGKSRRGMLLIE